LRHALFMIYTLTLSECIEEHMGRFIAAIDLMLLSMAFCFFFIHFFLSPSSCSWIPSGSEQDAERVRLLEGPGLMLGSCPVELAA